MSKDPPTQCRNGHVYTPYKVTLSWQPCRCDGARGGGHHEYHCRIEGCDDRIAAGCVDPTQHRGWTPGPI